MHASVFICFVFKFLNVKTFDVSNVCVYVCVRRMRAYTRHNGHTMATLMSSNQQTYNITNLDQAYFRKAVSLSQSWP